MKTLLIEIGTEEIPAGYIIPALTAFKENLLAALGKSRIDHGSAAIFGTPRRLALMVENVAEYQAPRTSTITGPPESVGFDEKGRSTIAAEKFASKAGVDIDQIRVEDTHKGRYLTATLEEKCESCVVILENILENQILSMPFPKRMRWGELSISFARPIISLVGLLGTTVLDFQVGNVTSSDQIFGHQFMYPDQYRVESADIYVKTTQSAGVIVDIDQRKAMLADAIDDCAKDYNARVLEDKELLDIVTNLVEYPFPVVGRFDQQFLEVPDEVLITAMREHQKCFALKDEKNGNLKPLFIAVNNTEAKDMDLVAKGHEKVLRARLADAKFFYEQDLNSSMDEFCNNLKNVTFQEKLGTVYEKTLNIGNLVEYLVDESLYDAQNALKSKVKRAAQICKADLVSQVVIEFTKLQGIIGRIYALKSGEDKDVALAIEQHYKPVYSGGELPENPTACLLAIADKMDTICGCFSIDLIPTGGADPYSLRRQSIGIIQIMLQENLELPLTSIIHKALEPYIDDTEKREKTCLQIKEFFKNRMVHILIDRGFSREAVNSALWVSLDNIPDVVLRVNALESLRKASDFESISITFKRVENILKKSENQSGLAVDENLFKNASEKQLFNAVSQLSQMVDDLIQKGDYNMALQHIAGLRTKVDTFFDDVMVMTDDKAIQNNRIALLSSVSDLFKNIANFSYM